MSLRQKPGESDLEWEIRMALWQDRELQQIRRLLRLIVLAVLVVLALAIVRMCA